MTHAIIGLPILWRGFVDWLLLPYSGCAVGLPLPSTDLVIRGGPNAETDKTRSSSISHPNRHVAQRPKRVLRERAVGFCPGAAHIKRKVTMTSHSRPFAVALLAIASSAFTLTAAPVVAMPTMPSLHFPQQSGSWGCSFYDTCTPKVDSVRQAG